ncbi:MAG: protein kinase [Deltaproteobacteria bacterium]|nr:protein kinase [Deltaproteobacteria bacterium]
MGNRYQLEGLIARGGMAEVHLARALGEGGFTKLLALKRILETYADNPQLSAMFMDEARLAAQLSHPNVVQVFDFGHDDQGYYIAMEYVPGPDLANVLKVFRNSGERPPEAAMVDVVVQVLRGLDSAHRLVGPDGVALNVIHRDVTPGNVLLTGEGIAKLSDFGVARATERLAESTKAGKTKGKAAYMSPEQARSKPLDSRSDIFAAGLLLFEVVSGHRCYVANTDAELIRMAALGEVRTLKQLGVEVDPVLQAVIDRALQREPEKRFPTAAAMAEELEAWHRATYPKFTASALGQVVQRVLQSLPPLPHLKLKDKPADPSTMPEQETPNPAKEPSNARPPSKPTGMEQSGIASSPAIPRSVTGQRAPLAPEAKPDEVEGKPHLRRPKAEADVEPADKPAPAVATKAEMSSSPAVKSSSGGGVSVLKLGLAVMGSAILAMGALMVLDKRNPEPEVPIITTPPPMVPMRQVVGGEPEKPKAPAPDKNVVEVRTSEPGAAEGDDKSEKPRGKKGTGYLTVKCQPWCEISIDGKPSEHRSPADHIPLPAGTHTLRLFNPMVHLEKHSTVVIRADENLSRAYNLVLDK